MGCCCVERLWVCRNQPQSGGPLLWSYVADEAAERIPGGVNSIVTLDPAADVFGGYSPSTDGEIDFARDSLFSWSFHSSSAGNEHTPTTADEAFIVESDATTSDAHGNVVFLFAYMLLNPSDPVSQFFLLTFLLNGTFGPWLPDEFESLFAADDRVKGYEAIIDTTDNGRVPVNVTYVPLPLLAITKLSDRLVIAWRSSYTNFVLQSSATTVDRVAWTSVPTQRLIVGGSNVVTIGLSEPRLFFRLKRA